MAKRLFEIWHMNWGGPYGDPWAMSTIEIDCAPLRYYGADATSLTAGGVTQFYCVGGLDQ